MLQLESRPSVEVRPAVLAISGLKIGFGTTGESIKAVDGVDLSIGQGEIHAVVGESGSGKTMTARAAIGLLPMQALVTAGQIRFNGRDIVGMCAKELRQIRGAEIGMIFQEPLVSLNPALTIKRQMAEGLALHRGWDRRQIQEACTEMLERVRIAEPRKALECYPHEFSGGMRQRIMLASVLLLQPRLLIADEPTTALDAIVQRDVLDLMVKLVRDSGTAVLLVSHNLGLVANYADRVTVMRTGKVVETGRTVDIMRAPTHVYTRELLQALPRRLRQHESSKPDGGQPFLEVRELSVTFATPSILPWRRSKTVEALRGISLNLEPGETLGIVGESGSGKTTLGRAVLQLAKARISGSVRLMGVELSAVSSAELRKMRPAMQIVFQDPFSSLDPRKKVESLVGEGLRILNGVSAAERQKRVSEAMTDVGLKSDLLKRYPHELSGGERQRVSIARAIIMRPQLIVADEPASALDVSVQSKILELLRDLQEQYRFSYLFISHDLGVIEQMSSRVMVVYHGRVVEEGSRDQIFDSPHHPYTINLLRAVPSLRQEGSGYSVSFLDFESVAPPNNYTYFNDGSLVGFPLSHGAPELLEIESGHRVACCRIYNDVSPNLPTGNS